MGASDVKGIEIHDRRERRGVSHTNKDIDWERSKLNYDLHPEQNLNFHKAVIERIGQLNLQKAVRKDAVVMVQALVTSDRAFFDNLTSTQTKDFFRQSYAFLQTRYGKENVVSATVHMDERTPHMHFNFVPVTPDGRLAAKSILTRRELIQLQTAFQEQVGVKFGLERGVEGGKKKHLEVAEYKRQTALEVAAEAEKRADAAEAKTREEEKRFERVSEVVAHFKDKLLQVQSITEALDEVNSPYDYHTDWPRRPLTAAQQVAVLKAVVAGLGLDILAVIRSSLPARETGDGGRHEREAKERFIKQFGEEAWQRLQDRGRDR